MESDAVYPCPCCGHLVFDEPPGSDDICSICFWHDDAVQLRFPLMDGGANGPSLFEAQANYEAYGAKDRRVIPYVRPPAPDEPRDPVWRPLDLRRDAVEQPGPDAGETWPADRTSFYYWRRDEPRPPTSRSS